MLAGTVKPQWLGSVTRGFCFLQSDPGLAALLLPAGTQLRNFLAVSALAGE